MATILSIGDVNINLSDIENFLIYSSTGFEKTKVINNCQSLTLMDSNKKTKKNGYLNLLPTSRMEMPGKLNTKPNLSPDIGHICCNPEYALVSILFKVRKVFYKY